MKKAIFPGSFNPLHTGHIEVIKKAARLFDKLFVVITFNNEKEFENNFEKRLKNVKLNLIDLKNVEVLTNKEMMTADLAEKLEVNYIVRSARNDTDYKYELELSAGNKSINKNLETILIIPNYDNIMYESRLIKQRGDKC